MRESTNEVGLAPRLSAWQRFHLALMPDYNRPATRYWLLLVLVGATALAHAAVTVAQFSAAVQLQVLAGAALAATAGLFPIRVWRRRVSVTAGEVFILLLLLLHGPAAATIAAAADALVGAWRTSRRWTSRIGSPTISGASMYACATLFASLGNPQAQLAGGASAGGAGTLLVLLVVFAIVYFLVTALLTMAVESLKRNEPLRVSTLVQDHGWIAIGYAGSAALALLVYLISLQSGGTVLAAAGTVIVLLLCAMHYYVRQQEGEQRAQRDRIEAAEREAAQAARHVEALAQSESRFHSAFTHASIGMALVRADGEVLQVNDALCSLLEQCEPALTGRRFDTLLLADDRALFADHLRRVSMGEQSSSVVELRCRHRAGHTVWVALHCGMFSDPRSEGPCLILQAQDITARRSAEGRLQHIAYHDGLTNLANRSHFNECLQRAIDASRRDARRQFAVLFLDFDRFKLINDSLGHKVGDEFLVKVAQRIQEHVRPTDLLARLGGDEFAVLTQDVDSERSAIALAERLQDVLRTPLAVGGTEISTSASIGITFSGVGYTSPDDVLRDADLAMYRAKAAGKARYALYDAGLHAQVTDQLLIEADLRRAIDNNELTLAWQPLFQLDGSTLTGFEALARWNHPQRGPVSPATFIPIAEESGLIVRLGDWVLEQACRQLAVWHRRDPRLAGLTAHVNISGRDLRQARFASHVARTLEANGVRPAQLTLEITESMLMEQLDSVLDTLTQLREQGVDLSVDDFGTGYSSLSYLSTLPISSLKIDASFVQRLQSDPHNAEIVRAVVTLGDSLGKRVIAEGIETGAQLRQLRDLGCGYGQGFLLSRPLSADEADTLLDRVLSDRPLVPSTLSAGMPAPATMH